MWVTLGFGIQRAVNFTFIISFDNSLIVACISGIFTKFCMAFMTSVLFCSEPATLRTAAKRRNIRLLNKVQNSGVSSLAMKVFMAAELQKLYYVERVF